MGLFDWFRRRSRQRIVVWFDAAGARNGLVADVRADVAAGRHVVAVAHFEAALHEIAERLAAAGVAAETLARWQPADTDRLRRAGPRVVVCLARTLPRETGAARERASGPPAVAVRACELHVRTDENLHVRAFAESLPVRAATPVHAGFDEPHPRSHRRASDPRPARPHGPGRRQADRQRARRQQLGAQPREARAACDR